MRPTDQDENSPSLGPPIRPERAPPAPRRFNRDGTIYQAPDGKLSTNLPMPQQPAPKVPSAFAATASAQQVKAV